MALLRLRPAAVIARAGESIASVAEALGIPVLAIEPAPGDSFRYWLSGAPVGPPSRDGEPGLDDIGAILAR